jgi:hypothetical protein
MLLISHHDIRDEIFPLLYLCHHLIEDFVGFGGIFSVKPSRFIPERHFYMDVEHYGNSWSGDGCALNSQSKLAWSCSSEGPKPRPQKTHSSARAFPC